ncbi:CD1871A family CXXC motif-containing protein [Vallitalea sediminicola]
MKLTKKKYKLNAVVLITAFTFILIGIIREEHLVVLKKATNICLECIGIG